MEEKPAALGAVQPETSQLVSSDLEVVLAEARTLVAGINRLVDGSSYDLQATLDNTRVATENLRDLTDTLKSYPSLLVLGDPPNPAISAQ